MANRAIVTPHLHPSSSAPRLLRQRAARDRHLIDSLVDSRRVSRESRAANLADSRATLADSRANLAGTLALSRRLSQTLAESRASSTIPQPSVNCVEMLRVRR